MYQSAEDGFGLFLSEFVTLYPWGQPIKVFGFLLIRYLYAFGHEIPDKAQICECGVERFGLGMFPGPTEWACDRFYGI